MRRIVLPAALVVLIVTPGIASAKLPFFGLDVTPRRPSVGEPITLTMTCFHDAGHTKPLSSCLGTGGVMAWVHPLDDDDSLELTDWIPVEGHRTSEGATRGRIMLNEPGSYDVLPLWRSWGAGHSEGFPEAIRIEVGPHRPVVPLALGAFGVAGAWLIVGGWRRRAARKERQPVTVEGSQLAPQTRTQTRSRGSGS